MDEDKKKEGSCGCGPSCNCRGGCGCDCRISKLLIGLLLLLVVGFGGYFIGRCSTKSCHMMGMGQAMCPHMQHGGPEAPDKQ